MNYIWNLELIWMQQIFEFFLSSFFNALFLYRKVPGLWGLHILQGCLIKLSELEQRCTCFKGLIYLSPVQTDATLLANNSQHCWVLHVASVCTPCCMLFDVVVCCCEKFETGQTFQPTTPNIFLVPWSPKGSATMLNRLHRSSNIRKNASES